jgi:hypothetical protein
LGFEELVFLKLSFAALAFCGGLETNWGCGILEMIVEIDCG